jgi:hypothetical protein
MFRFRTLVPLAMVVFCIFPALSQGQQNDGVYDCATGQPEIVPAIQPPSSTFTAQEVANLLAGQQIHCDVDGLIVHRTPDGKAGGGDTAQREGWYWFGVWIHQNKLHQPWTPKRRLTFPQVVALLEPNKDGVFYRHPKLSPWNDPHSKEWGFSRDQMIPLVAAMGVWGMKAEIHRLWDALPEDLLGKHAFNGNYRNFLGQDGQDCSQIKKRGCDATASCPLDVDTRDCSLKTDNRDCSLQTDTRSCPLQEDTRSCGHDIDLPFHGKVHVNDPVCEAAKAAQNALYSKDKAACEAAKAAQNVAYSTSKAACETAKSTQNALYASQKATCEAGKASQNAIYSAQKASCETAKTGKKYACEGQKAADQVLCLTTNVHSGDILGPAGVNLFRRALGENPLNLITGLIVPPVSIGTGQLGEAELAINAGIRVAKSRDMDDVGDDLNLLVMMLMAKLHFPSPTSEAATSYYATSRGVSYGSYMVRYYQIYGGDPNAMKTRVAEGLANHWNSDVSGPFGAVRWYHRAETGANPQLAELYAAIINTYIK